MRCGNRVCGAETFYLRGGKIFTAILLGGPEMQANARFFSGGLSGCATPAPESLPSRPGGRRDNKCGLPGVFTGSAQMQHRNEPPKGAN
jgi:hypothetical protein